MDSISLTATARSTDLTNNALRAQDKVPCVLYGNEMENTQLECEYNEIFRAYVKAGGSTVVDLDAAGKKVPVLFHEIDTDPVSDKIIHVDFFAINMKKEIEAQIPITFTGEAPAVKELGGILITGHDHVTVKCLPTDLPHDLEVSLEGIEEFGQSVSVADITVPKGVEIQDEPETVLASVQEPRKAEEEVPVESAEGEGEGEAAAEGDNKEGGDGEKKEEGGGEGGDS